MARLVQTSPYSGSYDNSMKEFYDGQMQSLVPELFPILKWLQGEGRVRKIKPQGKYIIFGVETGLGSNAGFRGEDDYLPTADKVDTVQGKVHYMKGLKGRIQVSFEALKFGKEGVGSFADFFTQEAMGVQTAMKGQGNAAMWSCGDAVLAKVTSGGGATSATVPVVSTETYSLCAPGTRWLHVGQKVISVDDLTAYGADMAAAQEIASIDSDTQFTMAASDTFGNSKLIIEHQATDSSSATERPKGSATITVANSSRLPYGIGAMCSIPGASNYYAGNHDGGLGHAKLSTNYGGYCQISESTYPMWVPVVSHNSGTLRSLTLGLFYKLYYKMARKAGSFDQKITAWMNPDMHREVVDLLEHYIEFQPRSLKPGYDEFDLMIKGTRIPIKLDFYAPGYIYFLSPADITFAESVPISLAKEGGSMWRPVGDKDNWEAIWRWMWQLYTRKRNAHGIICDLTYTVASV